MHRRAALIVIGRQFPDLSHGQAAFVDTNALNAEAIKSDYRYSIRLTWNYI
jgi:hypothetical protein